MDLLASWEILGTEGVLLDEILVGTPPDVREKFDQWLQKEKALRGSPAAMIPSPSHEISKATSTSPEELKNELRKLGLEGPSDLVQNV